MGERRKRKSMWDKEDDTKPFSGTGERNSRDHPGHPSWESVEENPVAPMNCSFNKNRQNAPERKDIGGENREYQNIFTRFDGMERHKYNHTLESDRSHSRRYLERGRSRSRSRSRTRGRSRSRSSSRGRGRERGRGRSRSRSRSGGGERGQSYGWSDDRKRVPDKPSQICRDFASGKCRRGNQCRFFHPKNEDDKAESRRSRAPYHEEDEQYPNKIKSSVPCKDFVKGKCRWGDTCRFSHHFASDETFGRGNRYASLDEDNENQSYRNGKSLCKYFAAGKCDRDNCRFSHEDPKQGRRIEEHSVDVKRSGRSENIDTVTENKKESWDFPEWKDNSGKWDKSPSPERSGSYGNDEFTGKEKTPNKQERLVLNGLQLQNQDGNSKGVLENNNLVSSFQSGQNPNQNGENVFHGHSSASNETNNGFSSDLNGPETHLSGQMTGLTETKVPQNFPNLLTEHLAQLTNSAVAIAGQLSHDPVNPLQNGTVTNEHGDHKEQDEGNRAIGEENEGDDNNKQSETLHGSSKVEENSANKDMRIFKNSLIEFVKEILKPTWKEGRMSREAHKTIVKKVVDKITSTIQADHVPKAQDKVEQYLSVSKPKIAKLVQAYVGRCLKTDS